MPVQPRLPALRNPGSLKRVPASWLLLTVFCLLDMLYAPVGAADPLTKVHAFTDAEGWPSSVLVAASDGNYYGATEYGGITTGTVTHGTIYRLTPGGIRTTLHAFDGSDGSIPTAVTIGADGNLYGTTLVDAANGTGSIFKVTLAGEFTLLYSFPPSEYSTGQLALGNDGLLYGMIANGDPSAYGTGSIYKITTGGVLTTLYSFPANTGPSSRSGGLLLGHDGNFYGLTVYGGGVLFRITPSGAYSVVHAFTESEGDGTNPLVQDADGNFYGTTLYGGPQHNGIVFKVSAAGTLTTLHAFPATAYQAGPLIDGGDGFFYGTTATGGDTACTCGTLFRVTPAGQFTNAYYFSQTPGGVYTPGPGLTLGMDGFLYGSAFDGDTAARVIYKFDRTFPPPPEISLTLSPTGIAAGERATLSWSIVNADSCTASDAWAGAQAMSGSMDISPAQDSTYRLNCTGPGGGAYTSAQLRVFDAPTAQMTVTPSTIGVGDTATLSWTSDHALSCLASGAWNGDQATFGDQQLTPSAPGNYVYIISCKAYAGDSAAVSTVTLVVNAPPGGSGGGALDVESLALGILIAFRRLRRRSAA